MIPPDHSQPIDQLRLRRDTHLVSVERHQTLASTNDRAKHLAREGQVDLPMMVLADQQTAGRGRGSNRWWTGAGSLAFSLLVDTTTLGIRQEQVPLTALIAGIAITEAVAPHVPSRKVGIHWPNDIFCEERKLAGILVEMPVPGRMVVGIGVNTNCRLADAPEDIRPRVGTLIDLTEVTLDHTDLLVAWLKSWEVWTARLSECVEQVGRRADELCLQRGRTLQVRHGPQVYTGECQGIGPDGALRLKTRGGIQLIYSGTIE